MSWQAQVWADGILTGSGIRKAVLACLARHVHEGTSECWPSQARIAELTEFSTRAVRRALAELEALQLIRRVGRKRTDGGFTSDLITLSFGVSPLKGLAAVEKRAAETADLFADLPEVPADTPSAPPDPGAGGDRPIGPGGADRVAAKPSENLKPEPSLRAARPGRRSPIPKDFGMTPSRLEVAKAEGFTEAGAARAMTQFCAHHRGRGTVAVDFEALWAGWISRAAEIAGIEAPSAPATSMVEHVWVLQDSCNGEAWDAHMKALDRPLRWIPSRRGTGRGMPSAWPPGHRAAA